MTKKSEKALEKPSPTQINDSIGNQGRRTILKVRFLSTPLLS